MQPTIREIQIVNHRFDPTETVLHVNVAIHNPAPNVQFRGRFNGPSCPFSTTIEIAYPLRERARDEVITLSAVIPEPSWWDPESPFVYIGFVDLMREGVVAERVNFQHAIYWLQMTSKGLRLNGQPFVLRGRCVVSIGDVESLCYLRDRGFNWLISKASPTGEMRKLAATYGFFVSHEPALTDRSADSIDHDLDILQESARQNRRAANDAQVSWFTAANPLRIVRDSKIEAIDGFKLVIGDRLPANPPSDGSIIGWIEA